MPKFSSARVLMGLLIGIIALIILLAVFNLGVLVGSRRTDSFYRWDENYARNFTMPPPFSSSSLPGTGRFLTADGVAGTVLKVNGASLVIEDTAGIERTVIVSTTTAIRQGDSTVSVSDVEDNDQLVVIGSPDQSGQIDATFIRILSGR